MFVKTGWPPVLMYHSISSFEEDPNNICTSPERFEAQMLYLKRRGLRGVSMRELRRAMAVGRTTGLVGLTFDDGYKDFLHNAVPQLERLGFSATVFVVTGMLGTENSWEHYLDPIVRLQLLGADEVREVSKRGMEVGSHSVSHPQLISLEPELLERELNDSHRMLSETLGEAVEGFCYPYGAVDSKAAQAVRRAGYDYACSIVTRVEGNAFDLPRIDVADRDHLPMFAAKLRFHAEYLMVKRLYHRYPAIRSFIRYLRRRIGTSNV